MILIAGVNLKLMDKVNVSVFGADSRGVGGETWMVFATVVLDISRTVETLLSSLL